MADTHLPMMANSIVGSHTSWIVSV